MRRRDQLEHNSNRSCSRSDFRVIVFSSRSEVMSDTAAAAGSAEAERCEACEDIADVDPLISSDMWRSTMECFCGGEACSRCEQIQRCEEAVSEPLSETEHRQQPLSEAEHCEACNTIVDVDPLISADMWRSTMECLCSGDACPRRGFLNQDALHQRRPGVVRFGCSVCGLMNSQSRFLRCGNCTRWACREEHYNLSKRCCVACANVEKDVPVIP